MLFDADVLVWALRGHVRAAATVDQARNRAVSIVTCMELVAGARDKEDARLIKDSLADFGFTVLPLSENIGHRALIYMELYALKTRLSPDDAIVAATAFERNLPLCTANEKHFKAVEDLQLVVFRP